MARIVDPNAGIDKLHRERCCRVCGRVPYGGPNDYLQRMHVVPKGLGGDDVDDNIVPGCSYCHAILTDSRPISHFALAVDAVFRRFLAALTLAERAYADEKKGPNWLASYYDPVAHGHAIGSRLTPKLEGESGDG